MIKSINIAYKIYKNRPLNRQYEYNIDNIVHRGMPRFVSTVAEDEIKTLLKKGILNFTLNCFNILYLK